MKGTAFWCRAVIIRFAVPFFIVFVEIDARLVQDCEAGVCVGYLKREEEDTGLLGGPECLRGSST